MRNKSNLKTSDERTISQRIHDSQLHWAKIFVDESEGIEKKVWENRVKYLSEESYYE